MEALTIPRLVEIDYNIQDDWIDSECRDCGRLHEQHDVDCKKIERGWLELLAEK